MAKIAAGVATIAGAAALMVVNPAAGSILATKVGSLTLAHMIGQAGLSIGSSLTLGGVAEEMRGGPGYSGSLRQPAASRQVIYGQCRVSGVVVYTNTTGHQLNQVIAWASHAVQSIDAIYLDGRQIIGITNGTGDADGNTHYDVNGVKYKFSHSGVHCESSYGAAAGKWLSSLNAQNSAYWGADCMLCGICATYIKTTYSDSEFSGPPNVKATIHGKCDIWDPRLGDRLNSDGSINAASHVWTDNWALCVADVLVNVDYGVGCTWDEIDVDQLIAAANICDESVPLANGGSEKRYTVNGSFDFSAAPGDTLASMLMAAEGRVTYTGGKFKIYPAAWYGTNLAFDHNDVIGEIKWSQRKRRDLCNAVRATYVCPVYPYSVVGYDHDHPDNNVFDGQWQPTDAPEYAQDTEHGYDSDANLAADGCRLYADRRYQFVTSCATVQRLMKIYLLRNRQKGSGSFKMSLAAYQTQAQDVIQMTLPELGWTSKYLEVQNFRFVPNMGDESTAPFLSCELDVAETNSAVYSWSTAEERGVENSPSPTIANFQDVDAPTGLTLASNNDTALVGVDGVTTPRILVSWDAITDPFVESGGKVQLQYQLAGASAWTSGGEVSAEMQYAYLGSVVSGKVYNVRIRAVRGNGATSDWAEIDGHTVATVRSVLSAADVFLTDTQSLQTAISNISSDNVLTGGEKGTIIRDVANIQNEQSGIDALGTFYGITDEKAAYDAAVSALNSYLTTLTSPVAWNDINGSTTIDGATFRSKFEAVYSARTALANKCNSTAKSLADTAKNTADTAKTTADNAQTTATSAQNTANDAKDTANSASNTASQAKSTADSASATVASLATEAMKKADFLDANGKIPADSKVSPGSITTPLLAANSVLAKHLVVANFDNLIPNPNSEQAAPTGGWPSGAFESVALWALGSTYSYNGSNVRGGTCVGGSVFYLLAPQVPCNAGDKFYFEAQARVGNGGVTPAASVGLMIRYVDSAGAVTSDTWSAGWSTESWGKINVSATAPANTVGVLFYLSTNGTTAQWGAADALYARRMADSNLIVDGGVTARNLAVGSVTAEKISFTAGDVKYGDGSTIESLKPAQAGADVTSQNTAAAIANQGALATKSAITSTELTAGCVQTPHLDTNGLDVGGGGGKPGVLRVFDMNGNVIGYVGGSAGGNYGAWYKTLGVGGSGANNPNLFADAAGNIFLNGAVIQGVNGAAIDASGNLKLKNIVQASPAAQFASTKSTSYSVIGGDLSKTITTRGNPILALSTVDLRLGPPSGTSIANAQCAMFEDGVQITGDYTVSCTNDPAGLVTVVTLNVLRQPPAGNHTYDVRWKVYSSDQEADSGYSNSMAQRSLQIIELG